MGFCGNVVLKVSESIASSITSIFKASVSESIVTKFAGLLLGPKLIKILVSLILNYIMGQCF